MFIFRYDIRMFLFVFWLRKRPFIKCIRNQGNGGGSCKMCTCTCRGEGYYASCVRMHLHYLISCFCLMVSCFVCRNLTLASFKKGVCQKWLLFSNEINFYCNEISFFYFKLFFRNKVSQNAFNLNQIESYVYSIFQCDTLL